MKFGFVFPKADVFKAIEFAKSAENAGWDGFFVWEPTYGIDAWVTLGAIALETKRIRLGTLLTPPSRIRPWKLASEVITLDILSKGRITLSVGLGAIDTGFNELGEEIGRKERGELLDESLNIMEGLWNGTLKDYDGKHYNIKNFLDIDFFKRHPPPRLIQQPRIPIWVVGAWPYETSMMRAIKYDGIIPTIKNKNGSFEEIKPKHIFKIKQFIQKKRIFQSNFDIIVEGKSLDKTHKQAASIIKPFIKAGATWWIESEWVPSCFGDLLQKVEEGPPMS